MEMRPASTLSRPARSRRSVVLPQPEGPRSTRHSPGWTSRSTSRTATWPSKLLLTFSKRTRTFVAALPRSAFILPSLAHMHLLALLLSVTPSVSMREEAFELPQAAEVIATLTAGCTGCSWAVPGREAAVLVLELDGHYSQHLVLLRGERPADYEVFLGGLAAGAHRLRVTRDTRFSARGAGAAVVEAISIRSSKPGDA